MTAATIATRLIEALAEAAAREAGDAAALVSVTIDWLAEAQDGAIETKVVRKTRTLMFMNAELRSDAGERIAVASSVHKLRSA